MYSNGNQQHPPNTPILNQQYYNHMQQQQQLHHQQLQRIPSIDPNLLLNEQQQQLESPVGDYPMYSMSVPQSYGSFNSFTSIPTKGIEDEVAARQIEAINEKRRKRRESHNAVERRRRDHINEKIQELSSLLPEFASDAQNKPNKGVILRRSVEYIRHMQIFAAKQMDRTLELEQALMRVCEQKGINERDLGLSFTLGSPVQLPIMSQEEDHME